MDQHQSVNEIKMICHYDQWALGGDILLPFNFEFGEYAKCHSNSGLEHLADQLTTGVSDLFSHAAIIA